MKSVLNFFRNYYFLLQSIIFLLMSALNFSDFERFWAFSLASFISFGFGDIVDELRKINKKMEENKNQE